MGIGRIVNRLLAPIGVRVERVREPHWRVGTLDGTIYDQDGLKTIHNHEFMQDPAFVKAYARGFSAAGKSGTLYNWHWRVHVGLWAAAHARNLGKGDFVECGVNRGFLSSAILEYLDWNSLQNTFYLLDTFEGMDERLVTESEKDAGALEHNRELIASGIYTLDVDQVRANFSEWHNVKIIQGSIPATLEQIDTHAIAYLSIDLNNSAPEIAAAEFLWDRLVPGAIILLDDYAYSGFRSQKLAMDEFARSKGVYVLSLPTGQGLIIRP